MSVKEIRELEGELKEVSVDESVDDRDDWEEGGFANEDVEEDEEEFSIGDTMLARGETKERWNNESLEDVVDWEASEDFEGEEDVGFSYEPAGGGGLGDMYGSSDAGDLYGSGKGLYGTNEGTGSEGSFYNAVGGSEKKEVGVVNYEVAGVGGKKKQRRSSKSALESGAKRKKGVSLI
jgi:hypothetical protein